MRFFRLATIALTVSALLVAASVITLITPGPRLSIEFTGGTLMEIALPADKTRDDLAQALRTFDEPVVAASSITKTTTDSYFLRTPTLSNEDHIRLTEHLDESLGAVRELQFTTIGPTVGASLKRKALFALAAASVAIVLYLAFVFRKLPSTISPWSFGIAAIVALLHDVLITSGVFTILSYTTSFQMDTLFVTALLSILGYSVNDTIIIFDRLRDNLLLEGKRHDFAQLAASSLRQTVGRTINTAVSTLVVLFALYLLGAESIRWFSLTLIFGTMVGTYSSFFVATPIVVFWQQRRVRR